MWFRKLNLLKKVKSSDMFIRRAGYRRMSPSSSFEKIPQSTESSLLTYITMESLVDLDRHLIKTNYEKLRNKCRNISSFEDLERSASGESEKICFHSPKYLIDLTEDTGDIVCTQCGVVVMERGPLSVYQEKPGYLSRKNEVDVPYSPDFAKYNKPGIPLRYDYMAESIIRDAFAALNIEGSPYMIFMAQDVLKEVASNLNINFGRFISQKKYRHHVAYAFFSYLTSCDILRHPDHICQFFNISYMNLLNSENLNDAVKSQWNHIAQPTIYCRPSQLVFIMCANFNLSYKVSFVIYMIVKDIESLCYGIRPEKIVFAVICEVLNYLKPNHKDKIKIPLLDAFRKQFSIAKLEKNVCFIPGVCVIKHMSEKNLI